MAMVKSAAISAAESAFMAACEDSEIPTATKALIKAIIEATIDEVKKATITGTGNMGAPVVSEIS